MRRWTRLIEERPQANGNAAANVLLSVSVEPEVRPGHVMPSHDSSLLPNKRVPTLSLSPSLPLLSLPTRLHPFSPPLFPPNRWQGGGRWGEVAQPRLREFPFHRRLPAAVSVSSTFESDWNRSDGGHYITARAVNGDDFQLIYPLTVWICCCCFLDRLNRTMGFNNRPWCESDMNQKRMIGWFAFK